MSLQHEYDSLTDEVGKLRSLHHYYLNLGTPLDEQKAIVLKQELEDLKEKRKQLRYDIKMENFLEQHPECREALMKKDS